MTDSPVRLLVSAWSWLALTPLWTLRSSWALPIWRPPAQLKTTPKACSKPAWPWAPLPCPSACAASLTSGRQSGSIQVLGPTSSSNRPSPSCARNTLRSSKPLPRPPRTSCLFSDEWAGRFDRGLREELDEFTFTQCGQALEACALSHPDRPIGLNCQRLTERLNARLMWWLAKRTIRHRRNI